MRWLLALTTWWFALAASLNIAERYSIGPVVYVWDETNGHGLHLFDVAFIVFACWWASRVTRALLADQPDPNHGTPDKTT